MSKYIHFLFKFKWLIIIVVPLIVFALALNLKHLEIDGSYRIWFEKDSKILTDYDKFRSEFSNDDGVTIVFKDEIALVIRIGETYSFYLLYFL